MESVFIEWNPPSASHLPANWSIKAIGDDGGMYKSRDGLAVIVSCSIEEDGKPWVHLSVSRKKSIPTWVDLVNVKEIFLGKDALAIQILPARCATRPQATEWVNEHQFCLHLYQCLEDRPIPDFRKLGTI